MNRPRMLVALALLLFLLQALPFFTSRWVEDDNWYSISAYNFLQEGTFRHATFFIEGDTLQLDARPPLNNLAIAACFKMFGVSAVPARLHALLESMGLIIATWLLGEELAGAMAGALAALFVAGDTFVFITARCARPDMAVAFFACLAFLFYFQARRRNSVWLAILCGLSLGAGMLFHVNGLPGALGVGILLLWEFRFTAWRQPRFWATILAAFACLIPVLWLLAMSADLRAGFQAEYIYRTAIPLGDKIQGEFARAGNYFGLAPIGHLPFQVPMRLPIVAVVVLAIFWLLHTNRRLVASMTILMVPYFFWWTYQDNKTARFLVQVSALTAILVAAAACEAFRDVRWKNWAVAACLVLGLTELAGNVMLIKSYRAADYNAVSARLQALIPPNESVYGAITFWLPLHDRQYVSYNRTKLDYMLKIKRCHYWILNDRLMAKGEPYGDNWAELRHQANDYARAHGQLVGTISNSFYGDLDIYRITY